MELREYQYKLVTDINSQWAKGAQNVVAQLSTGGGKTIIFSHIIAEHKAPAIAIAHRVELVSQISMTLAKYGIRHNIIAQKPAIREIVTMQMREYGKRFYDPNAQVVVAGVDTLIRLERAEWMNKITLVIQDEAHHPLRDNKWGQAAAMFPNARGLYPTATPCRTDGKGLGRHADGIGDALVLGPPMRELIKAGYLTDYRIFAPPNDLDLSSVTIAANGEYNNPQLRKVVHDSCITGDVVKHYLRIAEGKLGVTFAVDIESATDIAKQYNKAGVRAELITSKTPALLRSDIMRRFRNREILQIVNVDILGEGVDVPGIEVVSMARPTQSYGLYSQQFGRALRPMPGKEHAIIIDHVSNVKNHGLPDAPTLWTLDRRERKSRRANGVPEVKSCLDCFAVYFAYLKSCPYCGFVAPSKGRGSPEQVDGDLYELDADVLAAMRGEIARIDGPARAPSGLGRPAEIAIHKRHVARQEAQRELRGTIAQWAGYYHPKHPDSEIYKIFYFKFGIDMMSAQALNADEANKLKLAIDRAVTNGLW